MKPAFTIVVCLDAMLLTAPAGSDAALAAGAPRKPSAFLSSS
jgi:hypothetical protein